MGKKAKFKTIRRMAYNMPVLNTIRSEGVMMTGKMMQDEGATQVDGKDIVATAIYKGVKKDPVPMNHEKNMKKLYYKHGSKGVKAYVQNVHETAGIKGQPFKEHLKEKQEQTFYGMDLPKVKEVISEWATVNDIKVFQNQKHQ